MVSKSFLEKFRESLDKHRSFNLFANDYTDEISPSKLFIHLFGEYFSSYTFAGRIDRKLLIPALIAKYQIHPDNIIKTEKESEAHLIDPERSELILIVKECLIIHISNYNLSFEYGSAISEDERKELIAFIHQFKINKENSDFYMVQKSQIGLELESYDLKSFNADIETHYNNDFKPIHDIITNSLSSKSKNGLVLLHGKQGTGKTYYIRHLINTIKKKFIYFPLYMVEDINSPDFMPFISKHPGAVLILEDCESILVPRENASSRSSSLSNLLNLGDGLLSDALSVNVICTFNTGIKKIDDAILRKGRLLARYEFKELETFKARELARKLGKDIKIDIPTTVSDIYNSEQMGFENIPSRPVGFKTSTLC